MKKIACISKKKELISKRETNTNTNDTANCLINNCLQNIRIINNPNDRIEKIGEFD